MSLVGEYADLSLHSSLGNRPVEQLQIRHGDSSDSFE